MKDFFELKGRNFKNKKSYVRKFFLNNLSILASFFRGRGGGDCAFDRSVAAIKINNTVEFLCISVKRFMNILFF